MSAPETAEEQEAVAVAGPYKIGYVAPSGARSRGTTPSSRSRELAESGTIHAAFEEKLLLATLDKAYAQLRRRRPPSSLGETYVVYRTERALKHPVTGELFGYQSVVLGAARVVAVDAKAASLVDRPGVRAHRARRAPRAVDREVLPARRPRTPNKQALAGIDRRRRRCSVVTQFGEHQVVFVDRGEKDGVEEGNVFTVVRSRRPLRAARRTSLAWDARAAEGGRRASCSSST